MNIIHEFFDTHKAISVSEVEREIECCRNTLRNFLYNTRGFPVKHTASLVAVLAKYGFRPEGCIVQHHGGENFTILCPVVDKAKKAIYKKQEITDAFELIDWLESLSIH